MGKQSARLYYQGKDHKDIFYKGNFHNKMYKGNQLLWEKLYPDECLLDCGNTGIYIYDIEHKCVDVMPFYYGSSNKGNEVVRYLSTVGPALHARIIDLEAHSLDGMIWRKDSGQKYLTPIYSTYTDNSRLIQDIDEERVILKLNEEKSDVIYDSDGEWNGGTYRWVYGKGENYKFFNKQRYLITVDESGDVLDETYISNLSYDYMTLWRVGNAIYAYNNDLYKLDENTNTLVAISTGFLYSSMSAHIIYSDNEETIVSFVGRYQDYTWIASFRENGYEIKNALQNSRVVVKDEDGEDINIYVDPYQYDDYERPYMLVVYRSYSGIYPSELGIYMKNNQPSINKDKGFFIVGKLRRDSDDTGYVGIASVYFDNPYFLESEGNRVYKLQNYD